VSVTWRWPVRASPIKNVPGEINLNCVPIEVVVVWSAAFFGGTHFRGVVAAQPF
jgi:hypothetical protein